MIQLPKKKIAVDPIFDPDTLEANRNAFNAREQEFLRREGIELKRNVELTIPDQAKERCDQGIVKYVGPECDWLQVGDYVLFSGYTGTLIHLEGEGNLIIMPEEFVTAIIGPPATEIPGLYFKARDGEYFQCTYEMAIDMVRRGVNEAPWHNKSKFDVKTALPKKDEYERMR